MPGAMARRRRTLAGRPFTPPQAGSLQLWLAADYGLFSDSALTTSATADGTAVGGWLDKGSGGHNATQATAARRPVLKTAGLNGHPAVLFTSASSQWLGCDAVSTAFSGSNLPLTVVAVIKLATVPAAAGLVFALGNNAAAAQHWFVYTNATPAWSTDKHDDTTHSTSTAGSVTSDTNSHIISWISPGTTMTINVDGALALNAAAQAVAPTTLNSAALGALSSNGTQANFLNGNIAELFVWNTALSTGDQALVRAGMAAKYGISSS